MSATKVPTVFLSAATDDLEALRNVLHGAFSRAGFRVFTQEHSLSAAPGTLREFLVDHIQQSDCVIHLAGMAYGSDAEEPLPDVPRFQCSWTQFEYYYAHEQSKKVIAFVCAPDLSRRDFVETGADTADIARKQRLQQEHRQRVASGEFTGTPLASRIKRTLNEGVNSWEQLLQAIAASVASVHGLAGSLSFEPRLHTLPDRPIGFVGREADLAKLRQQNPAGGTVLTGLRGMGGIGKTALALVLAHEWATQYPDAQLFLDARGMQANPPSAGDLLAQVIQTFHPEAKLPEDLASLKSLYHQVLAGKRALILLDNARDAAQAAPLIPPAGCAFLVTSRNNFMLGNRPAYAVDKLPDAEATALLREHYAALNDADAAALVKLCAGLPLALRLAGAHLALAASERGGVANVAGYLNKLRASRLGTLDKDAPDAALITISETMRLSENKLAETERATWRKLGVFTASFDQCAAKEIAGADEEMLGHFVRRSLLEREGNDRYKLHDLAADYARGQLTEAGRTELQVAHARHFQTVATEAERTYMMGGGSVLRGLTLFDRERPHLESAFDWLRVRPDHESADLLMALVGAMPWTSLMRLHPRTRVEWQKARLNCARAVANQKQECWALSDLGIAYRHLGEAGKAVECHIEQEKIATAINDQLGARNALNNLGIAYHDLGDPRKAVTCHEKARPIASRLNDRRWAGYTLNNLGLAHTDLGDARKAMECYEQALTIAREISDRRGEGYALGNLGMAHADLGDARKAIEFCEQHRDIAREIGDRRGEGTALDNLGRAYNALGDARKAIECHERDLAIRRDIGDRRGVGIALGNLGVAYKHLGDVRKAIEFYEQALVIDRAIGDRRGESYALGYLSAAYQQLGDYAKAITLAEQALSMTREIDDRRNEGVWLHNLAEAQIALGDLAKAGECCQQALAIAVETGHQPLEGNVLWLQAQAAEKQGDFTQAIAHATHALQIYEAIEAPEGTKVRAALAMWRGQT